MPPKGRAPGRRGTAKNTTAAQGGDVEPERFTAGTGLLAESMMASAEDADLIRRHRDAAERSKIAARGVYLQPLDADGAPVGERHHLGDAEVTLDVRPAEELPSAEELAAAPASTSVEFSTEDPATVAMMQELTRIPVPTAVISQWFPSYFRPPGETQPWNTCKVFLTPQGLYVYRAAPEESETFTTGAMPDWYSTVDFSKTAQPVTGYAALNAGIPIETAAGRANVQPYPGCGCGHRKLKNWTPSWSRNRISWADAVALTDSTAGR